MRLRRSPGVGLALAWLSLAAGGCAYYTTSEGMVGGIRSVAVPLAANETAEADLAETLTERVEAAFARDGRLRVVDEESAEAVLRLTILAVDDAPYTFTAGETTEQYRFRVTVKAKLERSDGDAAALLELPRLEGWGTYSAAAADAEGRDPAVTTGLDMVIRELLDRASSSW
jgi:hypothetical protein